MPQVEGRKEQLEALQESCVDPTAPAPGPVKPQAKDCALVTSTDFFK